MPPTPSIAEKQVTNAQAIPTCWGRNAWGSPILLMGLCSLAWWCHPSLHHGRALLLLLLHLHLLWLGHLTRIWCGCPRRSAWHCTWPHARLLLHHWGLAWSSRVRGSGACSRQTTGWHGGGGGWIRLCGGWSCLNLHITACQPAAASLKEGGGGYKAPRLRPGARKHCVCVYLPRLVNTL
jgi:hypothetical protein